MAAKKAVRRAQTAKPKEKDATPDLIRVRATAKGFDGLLIRNEGEVFLFDVANLEKVQDAAALDILSDEDKKIKQQHYGETVAPEAETAKGHPKIATKENVI